MNKILYRLGVVFWLSSALLMLSNNSRAVGIDCFKGEMVTRELGGPTGKSVSYSFSSSCYWRDLKIKGATEEKVSQITLKVEIPGARLIETKAAEENGNSSSAKAFLKLRASDVPEMFYGMSQRLRETSKFSKDCFDYQIYFYTKDGTDYKAIFHTVNKDFYVVCANKSCFVEGFLRNHQISYNLHVFDTAFREWSFTHELVVQFVETAYQANEQTIGDITIN